MKYMHMTAVDRESTRWQRADPEAALIETLDTARWTVTLPDGNDAHRVTYFRDGINARGHCTCKGHRYHDICAHLITIRQADLLDILTIDGELVRIPTLDAETVEDIERTVSDDDEIDAEPKTEPGAVATDGGHREPDAHAAGSDGHEFGRPEDQL